jgi:hypothetical protein
MFQTHRLWSNIAYLIIMYFEILKKGYSKWNRLKLFISYSRYNVTSFSWSLFRWVGKIAKSVVSVFTGQLGPHRVNFPKTWYLRVFRKYVKKIQVWFTESLHTNECTVIYYNSLKFTLKCLKSSYMFRSLDHPQGAYIVPC